MAELKLTEQQHAAVFDRGGSLLVSAAAGSGKTKVLVERVFSYLTQIRQICCDPSLLLSDYDGCSAKREACMEIVQRAIEGEHRLLIFSQFTTMLEKLEQELTKAGIAYYKITGETKLILSAELKEIEE